MEGLRIPPAVRERLGYEGTLGLLALLDSTQETWSEHVLSRASNPFERRLAEEISKLRVELTRELHEGLTSVRQEWRPCASSS